MDKLNQEWISAAVDGDIDDAKCVELARDKESQAKWQRYHMIGDALRDELPDTVAIDLSANIAAALENEPALNVSAESLPPKTANTAANEASFISNKVVPLFKQIGQYAIAASVAAIAVIGVQNYQTQNDDTQPLPVVNTMPLVGSVSPVSLQTGSSSAQLSKQEYNEKILEQRRRINAYVQDHLLQQRLNAGDQMSQPVNSQVSVTKNQR